MNNRFKQIRETLGLSQKEFAEKLGKSGTMIQYYEYGQRNISLKVVLQLQKIFGINPDWLITGSGKMLDDTEATISAGSPHNYTPHEETIIEYYNDLSEADKKEVFLYLQKATEAKRIKQNFSDKVKKEQAG